jgi:hypothetical protein
MIYGLSTSEFSTANGWGYGWDGKHTYPYLLWQTTTGKSNDIGFTSINVEHDHPAPSANPQIDILIPSSNAATKVFNVYANPATEYYKSLVAGTHNYLNTTGITANKIISVGVMSESDIVNFESDSICGNYKVFPHVEPITGTKIVCVGNQIILSSATLGGVWSISNSHATIVSSTSRPTATATIQGVSEGIVYISYTLGYCKCATTKTFQLKVLSTPPEIKIGFGE